MPNSVTTQASPPRPIGRWQPVPFGWIEAHTCKIDTLERGAIERHMRGTSGNSSWIRFRYTVTVTSYTVNNLWVKG